MLSSRPRRTALAAALAMTAASLAVLPMASSAQEPHGQPASPRTAELTGTLLVIAGEGDEDDSYAVTRPNGEVVSIDPGTLDVFDADDIGNSRFSGRVVLPVVDGRTATLRSATGTRTPLLVQSAALHPRPTASPPVTHGVAVAQTANLGAYARTPDQLLAQIRTAADFWVDQADGKIIGYELPTSFVRYTTTKTSVAAGCGIAGDQNGSPDFAPVTQEAAALFPGYDFFNGTDQLVVLMPDACADVYAGRGSSGVSVVSGGVSIVSAGANAHNTVAHEWGHNYGLGHANTAVEYGDIYEVMGSARHIVPPELGTGFRHEQGLLQPGEVVSLTGRSAAATIQDRAAVAESGVRGVEVIDPDNGARLWFDLRTGAGSDAGAFYRNGGTAYGQTYRASGVVVEQDVDRGLRLLFSGANSALLAGETWSNASGTMQVAVSSIVGGVATLNSSYAPGPVLTGGSASIGGTLQPFRTVTAVDAGFAPSPNGLRYQWFANGAPLPDEESVELDIPLSLAGAALSVQVTAYAAGRSPLAVMSPPATVLPATFYVARDTANRPIISGKAKTGQVLSATGLSWVGDDGLTPPGLVSSFQWYRGRTPIKGATDATYELKAADHRDFIAVRNVASAAGFATDSSTSSSTARVKKGKLPSSKPRIKFKGKSAKPGSTLKAKAGSWVSRVKFRYQWYAGKKKIRGATKKTLKVSRRLSKKKITVIVMGSKKGYRPTARKSGKVRIR